MLLSGRAGSSGRFTTEPTTPRVVNDGRKHPRAHRRSASRARARRPVSRYDGHTRRERGRRRARQAQRANHGAHSHWRQASRRRRAEQRRARAGHAYVGDGAPLQRQQRRALGAARARQRVVRNVRGGVVGLAHAPKHARDGREDHARVQRVGPQRRPRPGAALGAERQPHAPDRLRHKQLVGQHPRAVQNHPRARCARQGGGAPARQTLIAARRAARPLARASHVGLELLHKRDGAAKRCQRPRGLGG